MLVLPRSARMAAWGSAALHGRVPAADAVRAVTGADQPHEVEGHLAGAATGLTELLGALATAGAGGLRVALPAPGDPTGLPGPAAFTADAVDAGEAVLVDGELLLPHGVGRLGLVPTVAGYGSPLEPGVRVVWRCDPVWSPRAPCGTTLSDAERELRASLAAATRALADLDVARWRDDVADRITAVRDGALRTAELPPGTPARAARVAASAARVRAIVELASEDDGAALSSIEALARARSLREVDGVARRALAVAVNAAAAGPDGGDPSA